MKRKYIRPAGVVIETYPESRICGVAPASWQVGDDDGSRIIEENPEGDDGNFEAWPESFTDN